MKKLVATNQFLKKIESLGFLLTFLGLIIKFSITDVTISQFNKADRNIESYQKQGLSHDIKLITGLVSPGYISSEKDFVNISNYLYKEVIYFIEGINLKKSEKDKVFKELNSEFRKVKDNSTYLTFRYYCDSIINKFEKSLYQQYDGQQNRIKSSNKLFMAFTLLGSFMIFISKWKLAEK